MCTQTHLVILIAVFFCVQTWARSVPYDPDRCISGSITCYHGRCVKTEESIDGEVKTVEKCVCHPPYEGPHCNIKVFFNIFDPEVISGGSIFDEPAELFRRRRYS
uniref:EGF-like domain-containing protein n=1 Tax=Schistocephalus solidus TaxID=70667 RepID=A0A0X3NIZ7_SCHSO